MKNLSLILWGSLLIPLAGCNSSPQMDYASVGLVQVSGTVMLDGQPLPGAVVTFESEDGQFSFAQTNASGKYTLQFDSEVNGVTPGEKIVRISTTRKILGLNDEEGEEPAGEASDESETSPQTSEKEQVPARYNTESELKRTVQPNESQTFDFELKSN